MVSPITGPTHTYSPSNPSILSIDSDLAAAQTDYTTKQTAVNTAYTPYINAKNALPGLLSAYNSALALYNQRVSEQITAQNNYNNYNSGIVIPALNYYNQQLAILNGMAANNPARPAQQIIVNNALADYNNKVSILNNTYGTALNTANTNLTNATNAKNTALTNLNNGYATFNSTRATYYSALNAFELSAAHLVDVKGYRLQFLDDTSKTLSQQLTDQLNGLISSGIITTTLYNTLVGRISTLTIAQQNYRNQLNNLMQTQHTLATARISYIQADDDYYLYSLQGNGPAASNALASRNNYQNTINAAHDNTATAYSILTTYANSFSAAYSALNDSFHDEGVSISATATAFNNQLAQAKADADALMSSIINQLTSTDATVLAAYQGNNLTVDPTTESAVSSAQSNALAPTDTILASGLNAANIVAIDLPTLPPAGKMSINDLMRFIAKIQIYIAQVMHNAEMSESRMKEFQLKLMNAEQSMHLDESQIRFQQIQSLNEKDTAYNQQVARDNLDRYYETLAAVQNFNNNVDNINAVIHQVNQEIDTFNANGKDVTHKINTITTAIATTTSYSTGVPPDSVNNMDILNQDGDRFAIGYGVAAYGQLPDPVEKNHVGPPVTAISGSVPPYDTAPGHVPTQEIYQEIVNNNALPPVYAESTVQPPSAADLDSLNTQLLTINEILNPIISRLGPPINFTLFDPVVYRSTTPVRDVGVTFDFLNIFNSIVSFINMLAQLILQSTYTNEEDKTAFTKALAKVFGDLGVPQESNRKAEGPGSGVGITSANLSIAASKIGTIINQILSGQSLQETLKSTIELASLVTGIQAAIRLPAGFKNYSIMGIIRSALVEQTQAAREAAAATGAASDMAKGLLSLASNDKLLAQNALALIGGNKDASTLSADQLQELLALLVFFQQLLLLFLGGLAGAIGAGATTGEDIGKIIQALFSQTTATGFISSTDDQLRLAQALQKTTEPFSPDIPSTTTQNIPSTTTQNIPSTTTQNIPDTTTQTGFSKEVVNSIVNLLSNTGTNAVDIAVLNKNGFDLDPLASAEEPSLLEKIFNQTAEQVDISRQEILRDEIIRSIARIGLKQESIDSFQAKVDNGEKLGTALKEVLTEAPHTLIQSLGVDLTKVSEADLIKIEQQRATISSSFSLLSPADQTALLIALSTGIISGKQASNIITSLLEIEKEGPTPANITKLAAAFAGGAPGDNRGPSRLPPDIATVFKIALDHVTTDAVNARFVQKIGQQFGQTLERMLSFHKFSIDFLLDPAKSILKNFSIATQTGPASQQQLPTSIPV